MMSDTAPDPADASGDNQRNTRTLLCAQLHLCFGWWQLFVFLLLGVGLETLHGLKAGWYLTEAVETRRLTWTLAHAHGTLLAIIHLAFASAVRHLPEWRAGARMVASRCLIAASIFIPAGFFTGGMVIYDGDPGLGILLVPVGALPLAISVFMTARSSYTHTNDRIA